MAYFTTLYSGSSGNCALIRSEDKYLLIDMGKSCRTTLTALKSLGLAVSDCVGILVTHEHSDHVSGLDTFLKKHPVPLYGCADTPDTLASRGTIPPAVEAIPVDGQTLGIPPAMMCPVAATASAHRKAASWRSPQTSAT